MKRRTYVAVSLLVISGIALACDPITLPPPPAPVRVGFGQTAQEAIGEVLQVMYGNAFNSSEVFMEVAITGPLGAACIVPFTKSCGENFKGEVVGDYSGGGGGGGFTSGLRPLPIVDGGTNTGTVTVGDVTSAP